MTIDSFGGRKSLMALAVLLVGAGIDLYSKAGLSANMLQLLSIVFGAFCAGNAVEHAAGAFKKPETQLNQTITEYTAAPESLEKTLQLAVETKQSVEMTQKASEATLQAVGFLVDYVKKAGGGA